MKWGRSLEQLSKLYDKELGEGVQAPLHQAGNSPEVLVIEEELRSKQGVLRTKPCGTSLTPPPV
jgi:hypothetical protein